MARQRSEILVSALVMLDEALVLLVETEADPALAEERADIRPRLQRLAIVLNASMPTNEPGEPPVVATAERLELEAWVLREEALDVRARVGLP